MGNDLNLVHDGKQIANLGRKHDYMLYGSNEFPSKKEIEAELNRVKIEIFKAMVIIIVSDKKEDAYEAVDDFEDILERYEELSYLAGKVSVISDLVDEFNENDIEILDDYEMEKKYKGDEEI